MGRVVASPAVRVGDVVIDLARRSVEKAGSEVRLQRLRRKLEDDPRNPRGIVSAGSRGYRVGGST